VSASQSNNIILRLSTAHVPPSYPLVLVLEANLLTVCGQFISLQLTVSDMHSLSRYICNWWRLQFYIFYHRVYLYCMVAVCQPFTKLM